MRIISGKWKGKRLMAPKNLPVRPTTDFAKEGLFNIINTRLVIEELHILDLFAGIGSISYEFASRGCRRITAVDENAQCIKFIASTKKQLELENLSAIKADVFKYLEQKSPQNYDIIFADAPFDFEKQAYQRIISLVEQNQWLTSDGVLIVEHSKKQNLSDIKGYTETRKYGNVHFSFFHFPLSEPC